MKNAKICKACGHAYYGGNPVKCVTCHGVVFGDLATPAPVAAPGK